LVVIFTVLVAETFAFLVGIARRAGMDVVAVSATEPGPFFEFWCGGCHWRWCRRWCRRFDRRGGWRAGRQRRLGQRRRQSGSGSRGWGIGGGGRKGRHRREAASGRSCRRVGRR